MSEFSSGLLIEFYFTIIYDNFWTLHRKKSLRNNWKEDFPSISMNDTLKLLGYVSLKTSKWCIYYLHDFIPWASLLLLCSPHPKTKVQKLYSIPPLWMSKDTHTAHIYSQKVQKHSMLSGNTLRKRSPWIININWNQRYIKALLMRDARSWKLRKDGGNVSDWRLKRHYN